MDRVEAQQTIPCLRRRRGHFLNDSLRSTRTAINHLLERFIRVVQSVLTNHTNSQRRTGSIARLPPEQQLYTALEGTITVGRASCHPNTVYQRLKQRTLCHCITKIKHAGKLDSVISDQISSIWLSSQILNTVSCVFRAFHPGSTGSIMLFMNGRCVAAPISGPLINR